MQHFAPTLHRYPRMTCYAALALLLFTLASCGGDSNNSALPSRILAQKASHLTYAVDNIDLKIDIENFNGIKDQINKNLTEIPKGQQEVVERVLSDENFDLVINQKSIPFHLTPRGDFRDDITTTHTIAGCALGLSQNAKIISSYDTIEMSLTLDAELKGEFCRGPLEDELTSFVNRQLETYPIATLKNAYQSFGDTLKGIRKVGYKLSLKGKVM